MYVLRTCFLFSAICQVVKKKHPTSRTKLTASILNKKDPKHIAKKNGYSYLLDNTKHAHLFIENTFYRPLGNGYYTEKRWWE